MEFVNFSESNCLKIAYFLVFVCHGLRFDLLNSV